MQGKSGNKKINKIQQTSIQKVHKAGEIQKDLKSDEQINSNCNGNRRNQQAHNLKLMIIFKLSEFHHHLHISNYCLFKLQMQFFISSLKDI
jgi:hypothetical protein